MQLEIRQGDPLSFDGDALLVPTNSDGRMVDGLAARIRDAAGPDVQEEILRSAPIAVGAAVVTGAGALPARRLIHVPVVEEPGLRPGIESIRRATRAGLLAANHFRLDRIAIPGIGCGENGVPHDETARAIINELRAFKGQAPNYVTLVDPDLEMIQAFLQEMEDK